MLPALAPTDASLVNGRTLAVRFDPLDDITVTMMVAPDGRCIHGHVMFRRADNGTWDTLTNFTF